MRKTFSALAAIGAVSAMMLSAPAAVAKDKPTGEERLAKMLDGRVAGKPQNCIYAPAISDMTVIDKTAIVIKRGSTLYVNRPSNAHDLDSHDMLVIKRQAHELCRLDSVTMRTQPPHSFFSGAVFLGDFVPYTKSEG